MKTLCDAGIKNHSAAVGHHVDVVRLHCDARHPERSEGSHSSRLVTLSRLCAPHFECEVPRFARDDDHALDSCE
jgi:hypothetical protein